MKRKSASQLTLRDFDEFPIWEPWDDLEDDEQEVVPIVEFDTLDFSGIYFIAAQFTLADGTIFDGYIRISWYEVKVFYLATSEERFAHFSVSLEDPTEKYHQELADELGKVVDNVFPLEFRTKVKFGFSGEAF